MWGGLSSNSPIIPLNFSSCFVKCAVSSSSAVAKWVNIPSNSNGPFRKTASTSVNSFSLTTPIRPIPESTATCTFKDISFNSGAACRSHSTESTVAVIWFLANSGASSTRLNPRIKMGSIIPASLKAKASSTFATQNPWTPASKAALATGIIPCPYAFAFTTA